MGGHRLRWYRAALVVSSLVGRTGAGRPLAGRGGCGGVGRGGAAVQSRGPQRRRVAHGWRRGGCRGGTPGRPPARSGAPGPRCSRVTSDRGLRSPCSATGLSSATSSPRTPAAPGRGAPTHVIIKGSTPVLSPAEARQVPRSDRLRHPGWAPAPGAPLGDALQFRAGELGPGDDEDAGLPAGAPGGGSGSRRRAAAAA